MATSPLMAWWALLFVLSMLARYEPTIWRDALDIDASEFASDLEVALDAGLSAVPELVYDALTGRRHLWAGR